MLSSVYALKYVLTFEAYLPHESSSLSCYAMSRFLDQGSILRDLRDGGEVEHGSGSWANLRCAEPKQQEVVDELLVLSHAKFL
jgi:hypothetical protein